MADDRLGQIWTPQSMVEHILDVAGYQPEAGIEKMTIMEPSFGSGVFLREIISRLWKACHDDGMKDSAIAAIIDENVYGIEYDKDVFNAARTSLIGYAASMFGLNLHLPHLVRMDTLDYTPDTRFDFVVGNPPYIRIHHLPENQRAKLRRLDFTGGTTDLYVAFYEMGFSWLSDRGILSYIAPSSWMTNKSQQEWRKSLVSNGSILSIEDYSNVKVFDVGTYTAVLTLTARQNATFTYEKAIGDTGDGMVFEKSITVPMVSVVEGNIMERCLPKKEGMRMAAWTQDSSHSIGALFHVSNGVATLLDKAFLLDENDKAFTSPHTRPVVKGSKYNGGDITRRIIFPYRKRRNAESGELYYTPLHESTMLSDTAVISHLGEYKDDLLKRNVDKDAAWYQYGRSQAINYTDVRKIVLHSYVSPEKGSTIEAHIVPAGTIVYSGIFITEEPGSLMTLEMLLPVLRSTEFAEYSSMVGSKLGGGYRRIGTPDVKRFVIPQKNRVTL